MIEECVGGDGRNSTILVALTECKFKSAMLSLEFDSQSLDADHGFQDWLKNSNGVVLDDMY
jgi:hypothetical protein